MVVQRIQEIEGQLTRQVQKFSDVSVGCHVLRRDTE